MRYPAWASTMSACWPATVPFPENVRRGKPSRSSTAIRPSSKSSVLFLSADIALIEHMARELRPTMIHLGASTNLLRPQDVIDLRKELPNLLFMRSVPVTGSASIAIARSYDGIVDFLLLDSHREGDEQIGALGVTHDWNISRHIVETVRTPVILAGGLGPDNVADAILAVKPAGVDSKTRTDFGDTHTKDLTKVAAFNKAAKGVALT